MFTRSLAVQTRLLALLLALGLLSVFVLLGLEAHYRNVQGDVFALRSAVRSASSTYVTYLERPTPVTALEATQRTEHVRALAEPLAGRFPELVPLVRAHARAFDALRRTQEARGRSENAGAEGQMRASAHALERAVGDNPALLAALLSVRRHEKDFLLRGRLLYSTQTLAALDTLEDQVRASGRPALLVHTGAYREAFRLLVRLHDQALREHDAFARAERNVLARIDRAAAQVRATDARLFVSIVVLLLIGGMGLCATAVWSVRAVLYPLQRMSMAARQLASDDVPGVLPASRYRELGSLSEALEQLASYVVARRRAERALAETQRFLNAVVHSVDEAMIVLDAQQRIRLVNPAFERVTGLRSASLVGQPVEVLSWLDRDAPHRLNLALRGEAVRSPDLCLTHAETGAPFWYAASLAPLRATDGAVVGVVASLHDLTERKASERALLEAQAETEQTLRFRTALLNNLSHELRTPLTGILGFAQVLRCELAPEHAEFATLIEASGERLLGTLTALLSLAELEANPAPFALTPCDLRIELEETLRPLRPTIEASGLRFAVTFPEDCQAYTHPIAFRYALQHLLNNAFKFTHEGSVYVDVRAFDTCVEVRVRDTGPGIAPEHLAHIFDDFWQASGGLTRSHEGTGLGLALTRRLMARLDGTITVESALGHGTTFTLTLPRYLTNAAPVASSRTAAAA